ncbi:MAG: M20/M25/M40 family metallo-hydrolase [Oscillospiraceae bacterium]|nr:M20/M25/M40 family metallo-hydrolase [Oscillospiraceae bacterium]
MMDAYEIIEALCSQKGVSGREKSAVAAARNILKEYPCETDALGNLIATVREAQPGEKTVVLEAHIDRIGLMVSYIDDEDFLRVQRAGGVDPHTLMGSELIVTDKKGEDVTGVVGLPFPYPAKPHNTVADSEREMPAIDEMRIDTGFEKPGERVRLGAEAIMKADIFRLLGTRVAAPCLDDRACCASLILAAQLLKNEDIRCGLKLLLSTREEIGGMGAMTGVFPLDADEAIAVDVTTGDAPDVKEEESTCLGKGPQIDIAPILSDSLTNRLIDIAKKENIPYQLFVDARSTGTDADEMTTVGRGVRTALVSLPIRFMHHPVETLDLTDVDAAAKLLAAYVKEVR